MGNTALKIVETPETKALAEFDVTEAALAEIKEYERLEIQDSKSEANVRKCRAVVRSMRTDVERRRKELKAPLLEHGRLIDQTAKDLTARLLPTENNLDEKIKAVEAVAEAAKAEKMAAEKARTDAILSEITRMENITATAQEYGLPSPRVQELLSDLEAFPVKPEFFEEFTDNALAAKKRDIEIVQACLDRTLKFEADQKAQAEIEAANKAEADRLAKIAAEQEKARKEAEAAQAKADAEARAERDAEAAKLAQERAKIDAEKAAIKAERDRMAAEAEKVKFAERVRWCEQFGAEWYTVDWNEAHVKNEEINNQKLVEKSRSWGEAIEMNEQINLGQAMADDIEAARLEALKPDKEILSELVETIKAIKMPSCKSKEGKSAVMWVQNTLTALAGDLDDAVRSW